MLAKPDHAYRPPALAALRRLPGLLRLSREADYFSNELRSLGFNTEPRLLFAHRSRFRERLERQVPDPALRQKRTIVLGTGFAATEFLRQGPSTAGTAATCSGSGRTARAPTWAPSSPAFRRPRAGRLPGRSGTGSHSVEVGA